MQTSNALDPQSPLARAIYDLAIHSTIIFALIFVIVTGAIIYAIFRFRGRDGGPIDSRGFPPLITNASRLSVFVKRKSGMSFFIPTLTRFSLVEHDFFVLIVAVWRCCSSAWAAALTQDEES
jgi:hypothetical protein